MAVEGPGAERGFVTAAPSKLQGLTEKQRLDYLQVQCPPALPSVWQLVCANNLTMAPRATQNKAQERAKRRAKRKALRKKRRKLPVRRRKLRVQMPSHEKLLVMPPPDGVKGWNFGTRVLTDDGMNLSENDVAVRALLSCLPCRHAVMTEIA